jgi:hypothetical protein
MNSKKRGFKKDTSPPIPSFDQLRETAERLKQEGRLLNLEQLLEIRDEIQRRYREDHASRDNAAAEAKPAKRKRGK